MYSLGLFIFVVSENTFEHFTIGSNVNLCLVMVAIFDLPIGIINIKFVEDLPMIIPGQFGFNCPRGFREEAF